MENLNLEQAFQLCKNWGLTQITFRTLRENFPDEYKDTMRALTDYFLINDPSVIPEFLGCIYDREIDEDRMETYFRIVIDTARIIREDGREFEIDHIIRTQLGWEPNSLLWENGNKFVNEFYPLVVTTKARDWMLPYVEEYYPRSVPIFLEKEQPQTIIEKRGKNALIMTLYYVSGAIHEEYFKNLGDLDWWIRAYWQLPHPAASYLRVIPGGKQ